MVHFNVKVFQINNWVQNEAIKKPGKAHNICFCKGKCLVVFLNDSELHL